MTTKKHMILFVYNNQGEKIVKENLIKALRKKYDVTGINSIDSASLMINEEQYALVICMHTINDPGDGEKYATGLAQRLTPIKTLVLHECESDPNFSSPLNLDAKGSLKTILLTITTSIDKN
ncbi:MAG: hypothetical protein V1712_02065 [Patescibacteria group bacterium]